MAWCASGGILQISDVTYSLIEVRKEMEEEEEEEKEECLVGGRQGERERDSFRERERERVKG